MTQEQQKVYKIALVGPPNSYKTSLILLASGNEESIKNKPTTYILNMGNNVIFEVTDFPSYKEKNVELQKNKSDFDGAILVSRKGINVDVYQEAYFNKQTEYVVVKPYTKFDAWIYDDLHVRDFEERWIGIHMDANVTVAHGLVPFKRLLSFMENITNND